jgi:hypothetical protein
MKFMMLHQYDPEYLEKLKKSVGKEFDLGAVVKRIWVGDILRKDGSVQCKAISLCLKGNLFSYLKFKETYGKVTTVIKGWPTKWTKK